MPSAKPNLKGYMPLIFTNRLTFGLAKTPDTSLEHPSDAILTHSNPPCTKQMFIII